MRIGKFLFLLITLCFYALLFSEQRMESREKSLEITSLEQKLEILNARKQELTILIEKERQALITKAQYMGKPLSPKDIIIIE